MIKAVKILSAIVIVFGVLVLSVSVFGESQYLDFSFETIFIGVGLYLLAQITEYLREISEALDDPRQPS